MKYTLTYFIAFSLLLFYNSSQAQSLTFTENKGQWHQNVLFKTQVNMHTAIFFEQEKMTYHLRESSKNTDHPHELADTIHGHAFQVKFINSNKTPVVEGKNKLSHYNNYFVGDKTKWASNVSNYKELYYQNIYDNIDLRFYSNKQGLKYDFIIAPQGNPQTIRLQYEGLNNLSVNEKGQLILQTSVGNIVEQKPYAYQIIDKRNVSINCRYVLKNNILSFELKNYNPNYPLVIDPQLIFASYTGSTADNWGFTATHGPDGSLYAAGIAMNIGYPTTLGAYQTNYLGGYAQSWFDIATDITISKFSSNGSTLLYSTYLGGSANEMPHSIIANNFGELYIMGTTGSSNFPTTNNAYNKTFNGGNYHQTSNHVKFQGTDIFVSKLSNNGSQLLASTYIGGTSNDGLVTDANMIYFYADDVRGEINLDNAGNVYVATSTASTNFPTTNNAFQKNYGGGNSDGVVFKFDNNLNDLLFSSFLGGSSSDGIYSLDIEETGDIIMAGGTRSNNFPLAANYATYGGQEDGFLTRISSDGSTIKNSTYYGSSGKDQIYFVDFDKQGNIYVAGLTYSPSHFFSNATYVNHNSGQFISKFNNAISDRIWSTTIGSSSGSPDIALTAFMVDNCNRLYLSGWGGLTVAYNVVHGNTTNLPITAGALQTTTDGSDFYFCSIDGNASQLLYASFFGGNISHEHVDGGTSRFSRKGEIYQAICAGCGGNSDLPTTNNVVSKTNNSSNCNLGVFKFNFEIPATVADFSFSITNNTCSNQGTVVFNNQSINANEYEWDFGDGSPKSNLPNPIHNYNEGNYTVRLIAKDNTQISCNVADTIDIPITIVLPKSYDIKITQSICNGSSINFNGQTLSSTGQYVANLKTIENCDSIVTLNLKVNDTYQKTITQSICNGATYNFNNQLLTSSGTYVENKKTIFGCDSITTLHLTVTPAPVINLSQTICNGQVYNFNNQQLKESGNYSVTLKTIAGCDSIVNMALTVRPTFDKTIKATLCPNQTYTFYDQILSEAGNYSKKFTAQNGCDSTITLLLEKEEQALINYKNMCNKLELSTTTAANTYQWFINNQPFANTQNAFYEINQIAEELVVKLKLLMKSGCIQETQTSIQVTAANKLELDVPNVFTPNNDGINDVFLPRLNTTDIKDYELIIFNRWGNKIFSSKNPNIGWDGFINSHKASEDVYVALIKFFDTCAEKQQELQSIVTLIR